MVVHARKAALSVSESSRSTGIVISWVSSEGSEKVDRNPQWMSRVRRYNISENTSCQKWIKRRATAADGQTEWDSCQPGTGN